MEIKEQQVGKWIIESSVGESIFLFFGSAFKYVIATLVLIFIIMKDSLINGLFVIPLAWLGLVLFFGKEEAFRCVVDKDLQTATVTFRAPWSFWIPRIRKFPLNQVIGVIFRKDENDEPKLFFKKEAGELIPFAGSTTAKIVESISSFLQVPLHIELGRERITHVPWNTSDSASLIPTPCASCGAPLPKIEANMKSVQCRHCNMNMVIQWQEGRLSYRAEKDF